MALEKAIVSNASPAKDFVRVQSWSDSFMLGVLVVSEIARL
jgi:hypothetical protein